MSVIHACQLCTSTPATHCAKLVCCILSYNHSCCHQICNRSQPCHQHIHCLSEQPVCFEGLSHCVEKWCKGIKMPSGTCVVGIHGMAIATGSQEPMLYFILHVICAVIDTFVALSECQPVEWQRQQASAPTCRPSTCRPSTCRQGKD